LGKSSLPAALVGAWLIVIMGVSTCCWAIDALERPFSPDTGFVVVVVVVVAVVLLLLESFETDLLLESC
jgi:UPF0716 family protein affecting phage T7 exclusion